LTFPHVQALVDDVVRVTDEEIIAAMRLLLSRCKILAEPAGAAATAALLAGKITLAGTASRVAAVVSGGNVDLQRLATFLAAGTPGSL
jgi:threonine dehydratase